MNREGRMIAPLDFCFLAGFPRVALFRDALLRFSAHACLLLKKYVNLADTLR
jgi:hypothetical protein